MKATELQKLIIDVCINNLAWWRDNNDIDSPTNMIELDRDFDNLGDYCQLTFGDVEARMFDLWKTILQFKKIINTQDADKTR